MSPSNPLTSKNPNPFLFFKFSCVDAIFVSFHFTLNSSKIVCVEGGGGEEGGF